MTEIGWFLSLVANEDKSADDVWRELARKLVGAIALDKDTIFTISIDYNNYRIAYAQGTSDLISNAVVSALEIIGKFDKFPSDYMRVDLRYAGTWKAIQL